MIKNDLIAHITKFYCDSLSSPLSSSQKRKRAVENSIMEAISDDQDKTRVNDIRDGKVTRLLAHAFKDLITNILKWYELNAYSNFRLAQAAQDMLL